MLDRPVRFPVLTVFAACGLFLVSGTADAAAPVPPAPEAQALVQQAQIYQRGRTPIYPYSYKPGYKGGWDFYFGFVPYTKGNVENEAIQRQFYPQNTWPHDPNAQPPMPYGKPPRYRR
jgi:hypothetical protein